jgi:UDP-N-acetylglucosamine transferase subunit ALG13
MRQLLLLKNLYGHLDHYFVTQSTPLAESVSQEHRCHFVPDVALGLLKKSLSAWWAFFKNFVASLRVYLRERPDMVLSTGAGTALNTLIIARLFGSKVVFLETFAHSQTPSLTGKIAARFVHAHLVQWEALRKRYPEAILACPLVETSEAMPSKPAGANQILVTVGTHGPFDRLIREVERLIERRTLVGPVIAQVGPGGYRSPRMKAFESCGQDEMLRHLSESGVLITHSGTGSILSGLEAGCKVIAIARKAQMGEHYDDHQLEILEEMKTRGAILGGADPSELEGLIGRLESFQPKQIRISTEPIEREIKQLLALWFPGRV